MLQCGVGLPHRWLKGRAARPCAAREPARPPAIFLSSLKWHSSFCPRKTVPVCHMLILSPENYIYTAKLLSPLFFHSIIPWLILPPNQFCLFAAHFAYMLVFTSGVNQIIHSAEKTQLRSQGLSSLGPTSRRQPFSSKIRHGNAWCDRAVSRDGARTGIYPKKFSMCSLEGVKNAAKCTCIAPVRAGSGLGAALRLWKQGIPETHLPIQEIPRFSLAGTNFVCVHKGFILKAHPEHPPDYFGHSVFLPESKELAALL